MGDMQRESLVCPAPSSEVRVPRPMSPQHGVSSVSHAPARAGEAQDGAQNHHVAGGGPCHSRSQAT
jgi:hypothetical protein